MSNQVYTVTASIVRDEEELEGALLPVSNQVSIVRDVDELEGALLPVATRIQMDEQPFSAAAVPMPQFEYDAALAAEQQEEEQIAYSIPQNDKDAVTDDSRSRVKLAERAGLQAAEQEREAISRANRKVFSHDYHAQEAVRAANHIARQQDRKGQANLNNLARKRAQIGLEVTPPQQVKEEEIKVPANETKPKEQGYQVGGYQVKEYQTSDYEASEYQPSEYKSVYD
jgi:hypothetical protein